MLTLIAFAVCVLCAFGVEWCAIYGVLRLFGIANWWIALIVLIPINIGGLWLLMHADSGEMKE